MHLNTMDPTSLERLAALKRQLPQKLPPAESKRPARRHPMGRHPLETTQDPEQLFAELIKASPDGHVPAHLLARLRHLEQQQATDNSGSVGDDGNEARRQQEQYSLFEALLGEDDD